MKRTKSYFALLITLFSLLFSTTVSASPSLTTTTAERNAIAYNWDYYAGGVYENNCLAYAMGNTTTWLWPWGADNPTVSTVQTWLAGQGYSGVLTGPLQGKLQMTAYALNGRVTHFARAITETTVRAKWGHAEIFNHSNLDPYTNVVYGGLALRICKPGVYY